MAAQFLPNVKEPQPPRPARNSASSRACDLNIEANMWNNKPADLTVDGVSGRHKGASQMMNIAARLAVSPKTVDTYRARLMRKLNIHDVAGLVKYAIQVRDITASLHADVDVSLYVGRNLPIGIVGTLLIATLLYCSLSLVMCGMVPYQEVLWHCHAHSH